MTRIHHAMVVEVVVLAVITAVIGYWLWIQPNVITINDAEHIKLDKTSYSSGDRITYTINFCKTNAAPVTIYRTIVNSYRINYETFTSNFPKGCRTIMVSDLVVPSFLKGGGHTYHIDAQSIVRVNPIRTQTISWRSVDFTIN